MTATAEAPPISHALKNAIIAPNPYELSLTDHTAIDLTTTWTNHLDNPPPLPNPNQDFTPHNLRALYLTLHQEFPELSQTNLCHAIAKISFPSDTIGIVIQEKYQGQLINIQVVSYNSETKQLDPPKSVVKITPIPNATITQTIICQQLAESKRSHLDTRLQYLTTRKSELELLQMLSKLQKKLQREPSKPQTQQLINDCSLHLTKTKLYQGNDQPAVTTFISQLHQPTETTTLLVKLTEFLNDNIRYQSMSAIDDEEQALSFNAEIAKTTKEIEQLNHHYKNQTNPKKINTDDLVIESTYSRFPTKQYDQQFRQAQTNFLFTQTDGLARAHFLINLQSQLPEEFNNLVSLHQDWIQDILKNHETKTREISNKIHATQQEIKSLQQALKDNTTQEPTHPRQLLKSKEHELAQLINERDAINLINKLFSSQP